RRLPGVRVADECCTELVRAALALRLATARYGRELLAQVADATADQPAVRFQLRFTRSAETDTAANAREVRPHALQSREHVLQLRQLDLHLRFRRARTRREDVEDQLGAVHHPRLQRVLEILALCG